MPVMECVIQASMTHIPAAMLLSQLGFVLRILSIHFNHSSDFISVDCTLRLTKELYSQNTRLQLFKLDSPTLYFSHE